MPVLCDYYQVNDGECDSIGRLMRLLSVEHCCLPHDNQALSKMCGGSLTCHIVTTINAAHLCGLGSLPPNGEIRLGVLSDKSMP
jgi:hypothetical protein